MGCTGWCAVVVVAQHQTLSKLVNQVLDSGWLGHEWLLLLLLVMIRVFGQGAGTSILTTSEGKLGY